jgi:hypothetical protein
MTRHLLALVVLLASLTTAPLPAVAADETNQYFFFSLGGYRPDNDAAATSSCMEVGYGVKPLPYLALEGMLGYLQASEQRTVSAPAQEFVLHAIPITAAVKAIMPIGVGSVYALGGGGVYYTRFHFNGDRATVPFATNDDDFATGYYYGAGGDIQFGNVGFGLLAKKLNLKASFNKVRNSPAVASFADYNYGGIQIMARVIYSY